MRQKDYTDFSEIQHTSIYIPTTSHFNTNRTKLKASNR